MPIPKPKKGQSQTAFMAECMHEASKNESRPNEQNVAICLGAWRDEHGGSAPKKSAEQIKAIIERCKALLERDPSLAMVVRLAADDAPEPEEGEGEIDFMERCRDELADTVDDEEEIEEICEMAWEDYAERSAKSIVHKQHELDVVGMEFILSDETPDRMGEVVMSAGWDVESFKRNPIALFSHDPKFVIGKWANLRVDGTQLKGHLQLAPKGISSRIDEIIALVDAGILKAVSVGFRPLKSEPLNENARGVDAMFGPQRYLKQELVETSLVAIPANPNALAVAKSLNISPATIDLVFAGKGESRTGIKRRGLDGGKAETISRTGKGSAMSLAQRITDIEAAIIAKKEALDAHWKAVDDSNVTDAQVEAGTKLNSEIAQLTKQHEALIESEKLLASSSNDGATNGHTRSRALAPYVPEKTGASNGKGPTTFTRSTPGGKELDPLDYLIRSGTVAFRAKVWGVTHEVARERIYGDDEATKVVTDIVMRAPSAPALTTVTGWAAELVHQIYADLMPLLMPNAIFTRLSAKGLTLNFGAAGKIIIPTRSRTPTIAGSFVGEGLAIPVRQGAFTSQALTPKKMAVITTWTREMSDHSTPAIEGVLREAIQQDTSVAMDSVLLDTNAATTIRPAGLLNGVSATGATAGGGIAAIIGDITALVNAISTATYGNLRSPVWLANQTDMLRAGLLTAANTGIFPFREEIARGTLANIPIIDSATVTAKTLILVDAADFVSVGGDAPRFEISDQATLHMEDTTPLELVGTGTPGTVAAPQRSLWQTDSLALRLVLPTNWLQRRAGTVAYTTNVTW